jgi:hypothetical protein
MMKSHRVYLDLDGNPIALGGLDTEERRLLRRLGRRARTSDWTAFDNFWMNEVAEFYQVRGMSSRQIVKTPIYQIAQDLSARLGIAQGDVRQADCLDQLENLVLNHFPSRRAFARASGLSENTLNGVLAGRKDLSLQQLGEALERAGYRLRIVPAQPKKRSG